MKHLYFFLSATLCAAWACSAILAGQAPSLGIDKRCSELIPLFEALPPSECFVTSMMHRPSDDLIIGATCGKKNICLFSFDHRSGTVNRLDRFDALWWDEPRLALGPRADVFLAARRTYDKQFVFERLGERPHTPGQYNRRRSQPSPNEINEDASGMPIRHYSSEGKLQRQIPLPEPLRMDGVGALVVSADGKWLCRLSSPGGHLFTVSLEDGESKDFGVIVHVPYRLRIAP